MFLSEGKLFSKYIITLLEVWICKNWCLSVKDYSDLQIHTMIYQSQIIENHLFAVYNGTESSEAMPEWRQII